MTNFCRYSKPLSAPPHSSVVTCHHLLLAPRPQQLREDSDQYLLALLNVPLPVWRLHIPVLPLLHFPRLPDRQCDPPSTNQYQLCDLFLSSIALSAYLSQPRAAIGHW